MYFGDLDLPQQNLPCVVVHCDAARYCRVYSTDFECYVVIEVIMLQRWRFFLAHFILFQVGKRKSNSMSQGESELMTKCQRALEDGKYKDPMDKLRLLCFAKGTHGLVSLGRLFRRMDRGGQKPLSFEEFLNGLHDDGIDYSAEEVEEIFER